MAKPAKKGGAAAFFYRGFRRVWLLLAGLPCFVSVAAAASDQDAFDTARALAAAGAHRLALDHLEQTQPRDPAAPRWAEREALKLGLLAWLGSTKTCCCAPAHCRRR